MIKENRVKKDTKPLPSAPAEWMKEIAAAYLDAEEAIPFGPAAGVTLTKKDLFHMAPAVCLKFRGLEQKKNIKKVSEAALNSYVATLDTAPDAMADAQIAIQCFGDAHRRKGNPGHGSPNIPDFNLLAIHPVVVLF